ncbi:MAG: UDP-N-acetylmuramate:L-alanyl-gamma-D-glutamyl-meso-diaminopimelate ligase [Pseudomonadota bacterium]|nr:MAG: UDP-N-acetylmuramate:L-alanyl-gamma-D-glutamyl-meso-diaminopimelate ligase [Pseudomonadota bacterium]
MNIHILGICGTFMGGLAALARADGHRVSGSDENAYPPMSTLLASLGIAVHEGYDPAHIPDDVELVLIGNALSRGNPAVEHILNHDIPFSSGPRWLGENYLRHRTVLAVAGTHGKTTTASMLAWILEHAGLQPGFLIGGVPLNFELSARSGQRLFVVEADEYDTAFFDKRAKFVHYRPRIAVLNNLEFDHADIYPDLGAIQTQFHHLVRTIPGNGHVVVNAADAALRQVLERGCWSPMHLFGISDSSECAWQVRLDEPAGRKLTFLHDGQAVGTLSWSLTGRHNALNALAAVAAAAQADVAPSTAIEALCRFRGVKRRLELLGERAGISVYDDFAHHPTAIRLTLEGLRRAVGGARILVALEPASNTMRGGFHVAELPPALAAADHVWLRTSEGMDWNPHDLLEHTGGDGRPHRLVDDLLEDLRAQARSGDHVIFMSNRGFDNAPRRFFDTLK